MTQVGIWSGPEAWSCASEVLRWPCSSQGFVFDRKEVPHGGNDLHNPAWAVAQLNTDSEGKLQPAPLLPELQKSLQRKFNWNS